MQKNLAGPECLQNIKEFAVILTSHSVNTVINVSSTSSQLRLSLRKPCGFPQAINSSVLEANFFQENIYTLSTLVASILKHLYIEHFSCQNFICSPLTLSSIWICFPLREVMIITLHSPPFAVLSLDFFSQWDQNLRLLISLLNKTCIHVIILTTRVYWLQWTFLSNKYALHTMRVTNI